MKLNGTFQSQMVNSIRTCHLNPTPSGFSTVQIHPAVCKSRANTHQLNWSNQLKSPIQQLHHLQYLSIGLLLKSATCRERKFFMLSGMSGISVKHNSYISNSWYTCRNNVDTKSNSWHFNDCHLSFCINTHENSLE